MKPNQTATSARDVFNAAAALLEAGDLDAAVRSLEASLQQYKNDPNLLRLLGMAFLRQNRLEEAERQLTHVVRLVPEFAPGYENLADAQIRLGKLDAGVASLRTAISHAPDVDRLRQRLADLLAALGRGGEADKEYSRIIDKDPDKAAMAKAMELNRQGETDQAEKIFTDILRRNPDNVDALRLMGTQLARKDRYNDAEAYFRRAIELEPDFWKAWLNLGSALNEQLQFDKAEEAFKRALALFPASVHTLERLGANALMDGRHDDAIVWLEQGIEKNPDHFSLQLSLGHALKTVGRQAEAIDAYRKSAEAKPGFGEVYWSLANLKTFRFSDEEVAEMERELSDLSDTPEDEDSEIAFSFALGKAFEDRRDYKKAFHHYSHGNDKKRFKVTYDPIDFEKSIDRLIDVFTKDYFAERAGHGHDDDSPILIVGLPRSGSTLLEQILASHSKVEGTAELHYLMRIATETGANRVDGIRYPEFMLELEAHHAAGLGQEYIERASYHRTGSPYFTDKMPNNFTAVGFLHSILPNAKVIDARRHPLDSCLGSFKQLFARGQVFSYDLYDLAHYYSQYLRIMRHWDEVLPGKVLTVNYEEVVDDLDTQARRIAAHCGLEWENQMLRFHETKRAVKTASSEQVRQPIYKGSVNLWRNYEEDLAELIDYLEPVLMDMPEAQRPRSLAGG